jgi:hypothetical protein
VRAMAQDMTGYHLVTGMKFLLIRCLYKTRVRLLTRFHALDPIIPLDSFAHPDQASQSSALDIFLLRFAFALPTQARRPPPFPATPASARSLG